MRVRERERERERKCVRVRERGREKRVCVCLRERERERCVSNGREKDGESERVKFIEMIYVRKDKKKENDEGAGDMWRKEREEKARERGS